LHYENLIPAVSDCIEKVDSDWKNIDAVALTLKPGLEVIFTLITILNVKIF